MSRSSLASRNDTVAANDTSRAVQSLIVLAEDNPELRTLLATALEFVGFRVVQAETGARLVEVVEKLVEGGQHVQLIITDVRMPTLGGLDAMRTLRAAGHVMRVIFMTAYGDAWTRRHAAELGGTLLDKPLSLKVLRQVVTREISS